MSEQIINLMNHRRSMGANGVYGSRGPEALVWEDQAGLLRIEVTSERLEKQLHAALASLCLPVTRVERLAEATVYGQGFSETTVALSYRTPGPALVAAGWTLAQRYPQHGVNGLLPNGTVAPTDDDPTAAAAA